MDGLDHHLLRLIQENSGRTLHDLGEAVGLSPSAVQRRLTGYRSRRLIAREVAVLDPAVFGGLVHALVLITLKEESTARHDDLRERLIRAAEVQQCYSLAGEWDYAILVVAQGMDRLRDVVHRLCMDDPNVKRFTTLPVFTVHKAGLALPTGSPIGRPG